MAATPSVAGTGGVVGTGSATTTAEEGMVKVWKIKQDWRFKFKLNRSSKVYFISLSMLGVLRRVHADGQEDD